MSNGPANGAKDPAWWWKAGCTAMFGLSATLMVKGCDEWQKTNATLGQLSADVKYQIDRVGQRELRLQEVERNMAQLYEETRLSFEKRRELADRLVNLIDERLDELERYLPERGRQNLEPKWQNGGRP